MNTVCKNVIMIMYVHVLDYELSMRPSRVAIPLQKAMFRLTLPCTCS